MSTTFNFVREEDDVFTYISIFGTVVFKLSQDLYQIGLKSTAPGSLIDPFFEEFFKERIRINGIPGFIVVN